MATQMTVVLIDEKGQEINELDLQTIAVLQAIGEGANVEDGRCRMGEDDETVCGCNGVDRGTIFCVQFVKRATSVGEVGKVTKAGTSCGKCKPRVKPY